MPTQSSGPLRQQGSYVDGVSCPAPSRCLSVGEDEDYADSDSNSPMYFANQAPPSTPSGLTMRVVGDAAVLTWHAPTDPFSSLHNYLVTQTGGGGLPGQSTLGTGPLSTRCVVRGLRLHVRYGFNLEAVNALGQSARTATKYVTIP